MPDPTRYNLDPARSQVDWNHPNNTPVGCTTVVTVHVSRQILTTVGDLEFCLSCHFIFQFKCRSGASYRLKIMDVFHCTVRHVATERVIPHVLEPSTSLVGSEVVRVSFATRLAGRYQVQMTINGHGVGTARFYIRNYSPGRHQASHAWLIWGCIQVSPCTNECLCLPARSRNGYTC